MKILKVLMLGILSLIALVVVISFFLPSGYRVERSATINASAASIFEEINDLKNWDHWSPWEKRDATIKKTLSEQTSGTGAWSAWTSEKEGNGKLTITESIEGKLIETKLEFEDGDMLSDGAFILEEAEGGIKVTWMMEGELGMNPIMRFMGLMMDKWISVDFEQGLSSLKDFCENKKEKGPKLEIAINETKEQNYISIRDTVTPQEIGPTCGLLYSELIKFMNSAGDSLNGSPFAIYHAYSSTSVDMEACLPVNKELKSKGNIMMNKLLAGKTVTAMHWGSYQSSELSHKAIDEWISKNNVTVSGSPWEVYITDPGMEPDTAKWQTLICYPVQQ